MICDADEVRRILKTSVPGAYKLDKKPKTKEQEDEWKRKRLLMRSFLWPKGWVDPASVKTSEAPSERHLIILAAWVPVMEGGKAIILCDHVRLAQVTVMRFPSPIRKEDLAPSSKVCEESGARPIKLTLFEQWYSSFWSAEYGPCLHHEWHLFVSNMKTLQMMTFQTARAKVLKKIRDEERTTGSSPTKDALPDLPDNTPGTVSALLAGLNKVRNTPVDPKGPMAIGATCYTHSVTFLPFTRAIIPQPRLVSAPWKPKPYRPGAPKPPRLALSTHMIDMVQCQYYANGIGAHFANDILMRALIYPFAPLEEIFLNKKGFQRLMEGSQVPFSLDTLIESCLFSIRMALGSHQRRQECQ